MEVEANKNGKKSRMKIGTVLFILVLLITAVGLGWAKYHYTSATPAVINSPKPTAQLITSPPTNKITLSPKQKIAQMIALPVRVSRNSATVSASLNTVIQNDPGFVILFGNKISASAAAQVIHSISSQSAAPIAPVFGVDHEGGTVQRLTGKGFTTLPNWQTLCAKTSEEKQQLFTKSAAELAQVGIQIVFGPVVDVATDNHVLQNRICSDDPATVETNARLWLQIFSNAGITSVIKHYPGIGSSTKDLHKEFEALHVSPAETAVFTHLLKEFPHAAVMISHAGVTEKNPDTPCSLSSSCIAELRTAAPDALVFSDAIQMLTTQTKSASTLSDLATQAILAGNDVIVFDTSITQSQLADLQAQLVMAYQNNVTFQKRVDESVQKIIKKKQTP